MQIGAFPIDSEAMNKFKTLFELGRNLMAILLPVFVTVRVVINLAQFRESSSYFEILKDLLLACFLLGSYMYLVEGIMQIPEFYANLLKDNATFEIKSEVTFNSMMDQFFDRFAWFMIGFYWFSYIVYFSFLALVCAFGAYLIVAGTLFQSYWVLKSTFWMLVVLGSWPIVWYTLNLFSKFIVKDTSSITTLFIIAFFNVCKLLVPMIGAYKVWNSNAISTIRGAAAMAATGGKSLLGGSKTVGKSVLTAGIGIENADLFMARANYSKDSLGVVASGFASVTGAKVRSSIANASMSAVKTAATPLTQIMPDKLKTNLRSGRASISNLFKEERDGNFEMIPMSSPIAQKLKKISPKVHSIASKKILGSKSISDFDRNYITQRLENINTANQNLPQAISIQQPDNSSVNTSKLSAKKSNKRPLKT